MKTVNTIIVDAISDALGLPRTNIQNDVIAQAVLYYNVCGKELFDKYTWNNRYLDQFDETPTSGIITFDDPAIDIVLAVKALDDTTSTDNEGTMLWAQNQINAFRNGQEVSGDSFTHLADDATGYRRIRVNTGTSSDSTTYRTVALKKFSEATVDSTYSAGDPSATPQDYRVLQWLVDHIDYALTLYISDKLRVWDGNKPTGAWMSAMATELEKVRDQAQVDNHYYPSDPTFGNVGDFTEGSGIW